MDAAEEFMGPLMSQMQLYDMMSVAMGCSQFHSSFLPKVAAAARQHGVELRRLVVAMGKLDSVNLDEENLNRVAASLPKATAAKTREMLTSFSVPGISAHSISSSLSAVQSLVDGMAVTCAKRRARPVLELVASESPSQDLGPGGPGACRGSGCARQGGLRFFRSAGASVKNDRQQRAVVSD